LVAGESMTGRDGHKVEGLPTGRVLEMLPERKIVN